MFDETGCVETSFEPAQPGPNFATTWAPQPFPDFAPKPPGRPWQWPEGLPGERGIVIP